LIGVWHKDNFNTIGNGNPHPTNIDSRMRSIRMTPRSQLFFDKSFFSSLENPGREIYLTNTQQVQQTRSFINMNCLLFCFFVCKVFLADLETYLMIDSYYIKDSTLIWSPYHTWKLCSCLLNIFVRLRNSQNQLPHPCRKRILAK